MPKILYPLLYLLSRIYAGVVLLRNACFDRKVLRSESFGVPVISVGNITVGGTGKTPHVAYLCALLLPHCRVAVLSRGYGRRTRGFRLASLQSRPDEIGDESCLLQQRFPSLVVAVDEKRVHGIRTLLSLPEPPQVILLDDAFQHRYVRPGLSMLLADYNRPFYRDTWLPAGRMRESFSGRLRADMMVLTKTPASFTEEELTVERERYRWPEGRPFIVTSFAYGPLLPVSDAAAVSGPRQMLHAGAFKRHEALVVTAIASPEPFYQYVQPHVARMETLRFPDHHAFTARDIRDVLQAFDALSGDRILLTTEKDAVRWRSAGMSDALLAFLYYIPVDITFPLNDQQAFDNMVLRKVKAVC